MIKLQNYKFFQMIHLKKLQISLPHMNNYFKLHNVIFQQKNTIKHLNYFYKNDYILNAQTAPTDRDIIIY